MRARINLTTAQTVYKQEYRRKSKPANDKYDGLESCRKNVIKCNCARKLKYCIAR